MVPKPALPVGGQSIMGHVLDGVRKGGITNVHCSIGYLAEVMPKAFGDGSRWGVNLKWAHERELLGTAGGVKALEGVMRNTDPFVVLSGDGLHNFDIASLVRQHRQSGALGSMALHSVDDPSRYGVVELAGEGRIKGFQEKPAPGTARSNLVNTGIYIFEPQIFDHIPAGVQDFGNDVFPALLAKGEHLNGINVGKRYWNDVGTLESFLQSNRDVAAGRVPGIASPFARNPDATSGAQMLARSSSEIHPSADVASGAKLVGTNVIGAGARIEDGARVTDSMIMPGAIVPRGTSVTNEIFGDVAKVRRWAEAGAA